MDRINIYNKSKETLYNTKTTLRSSLKEVSLLNLGVKNLVNITTNERASSPVLSLAIPDLPMIQGNGIEASENSLFIVPDLKHIELESVKWNASIYTYIQTDDEKKSTLYSEKDIISKRVFSFSSLNNEESLFFESKELVRMVSLKNSHTLRGKRTKISFAIGDGKTPKIFHLEQATYLFFEEGVRNIEIRFRSENTKGSNYEYLIDQISFGNYQYKSEYSAIFGPLKEKGSIIKVGISCDTPELISFEVATSVEGLWLPVDQYNSDSFILDLNSIYSKYKIKTNSIFIKMKVSPETISRTEQRTLITEEPGTDAYFTNVRAGGVEFGRTYINGLSYQIKDILTQSKVFKVESSKRYAVTSQRLSLSTLKNIESNYLTSVVLDPDSKVYLGSGLRGDKTGKAKVLKIPNSVMRGKYTFIVDGEPRISYWILGDYIEKEEAYELSITDGDNVSLFFTRENIDKDYGLVQPYKETEEAKVFSLFRALGLESLEVDSLDLIELNIKSLDFYSLHSSVKNGFENKYKGTLKRGKTIYLDWTDIKSFDFEDKTFSYRGFIDGHTEFVKRRETVKLLNISSPTYTSSLISENTEVLIYSSDFRTKYRRVYSQENLKNTFTYLVTGNNITFSSDLLGEQAYIEVYVEGDNLYSNLYSVDFKNGIVYLSNIVNDIEYSYSAIDLLVEGKIYTTDNIESEDIHSGYEISTIEEETYVDSVLRIPNSRVNILRSSSNV